MEWFRFLSKLRLDKIKKNERIEGETETETNIRNVKVVDISFDYSSRLFGCFWWTIWLI